MYIGRTAIGGSVALFVVTKNASGSPTAPTGAVTYRIYGPSSSSPIESGVISMGIGGYGYQGRATLSCTQPAGYASGSTYRAVVEYTAGGVAKVAEFSFEVT